MCVYICVCVYLLTCLYPGDLNLSSKSCIFRILKAVSIAEHPIVRVYHAILEASHPLVYCKGPQSGLVVSNLSIGKCGVNQRLLGRLLPVLNLNHEILVQMAVGKFVMKYLAKVLFVNLM